LANSASALGKRGVMPVAGTTLIWAATWADPGSKASAMQSGQCEVNIFKTIPNEPKYDLSPIHLHYRHKEVKSLEKNLNKT
jgi:hypothetical protein